MKIVNLNINNIPGVAELEKECFVHPWSEQSIRDYFGNPDAHFFVATDDTENGAGEARDVGTSAVEKPAVVGYIGSYIVCDEAYITNVAVKKSSRQQGIGTALLEKCVDCAKSCGASFISLEVRISNTPAINLYKRAGFESAGVRPSFYRDPDEDAIIMTKRFKPYM